MIQRAFQKLPAQAFELIILLTTETFLFLYSILCPEQIRSHALNIVIRLILLIILLI